MKSEDKAYLIGFLGLFVTLSLIVSLLIGWGIYSRSQRTVTFQSAVEAGLEQCQQIGNYDWLWVHDCPSGRR